MAGGSGAPGEGAVEASLVGVLLGQYRDEQAARYVAMLCSWVRGHLDWGRATGRYRPAA